jgi:hypothetical protein
LEQGSTRRYLFIARQQEYCAGAHCSPVCIMAYKGDAN